MLGGIKVVSLEMSERNVLCLTKLLPCWEQRKPLELSFPLIWLWNVKCAPSPCGQNRYKLQVAFLTLTQLNLGSSYHLFPLKERWRVWSYFSQRFKVDLHGFRKYIYANLPISTPIKKSVLPYRNMTVITIQLSLFFQQQRAKFITSTLTCLKWTLLALCPDEEMMQYFPVNPLYPITRKRRSSITSADESASRSQVWLLFLGGQSTAKACAEYQGLD